MTSPTRHAERLVSERETTLVDAIPFPAALLDADGIVLAANAGAVEAFGDGLVGARLLGRIDAADAIAPGAAIARSFPWRDGRVEIHEWRSSGGLSLALLFDGAADQRVLARAREVALTVKHEINNLLMGLLGLSALLRGRPELSDGSRAKAQQIEEQGRKIRDVVARLDELKKP